MMHDAVDLLVGGVVLQAPVVSRLPTGRERYAGGTADYPSPPSS